jgi:hypothetical protein
MAEISELNVMRVELTCLFTHSPPVMMGELAVGTTVGLDADDQPITMQIEGGAVVCPVVSGIAAERDGSIVPSRTPRCFKPKLGQIRFHPVNEAMVVPDLRDINGMDPEQFLDTELLEKSENYYRFTIIGEEVVQSILTKMFDLPDEMLLSEEMKYAGLKRYFFRSMARAVIKELT